MQDDETVHIPGLGETEALPDGAIAEYDAIPEMPPGSDAEDIGRGSMGGGLDVTDTAQPTSTADTTGDGATGLTGLRGG